MWWASWASLTGSRGAGVGELELTLRPRVPMGYLVALPAVASLGVMDALVDAGNSEAGLLWPRDVALVPAGRPAFELDGRGGYDDGGVFVRLAIRRTLGDGDDAAMPDDAAIERAVRERVSTWEGDVAAGRSAGGPWAAFLPDYFDHELRMGREVEVTYPNGRVMARGHLAGFDIWGRATVVDESGRELEFSAEQALLRSPDRE